jgi:hypothetical protein
VWDIDVVEGRGQYTISKESSPEPMRREVGNFQVNQDETMVMERTGLK